VVGLGVLCAVVCVGQVLNDFISVVLANADAFRWLFFIGVLWAFYSWMQGEDSKGIEWRDYVSAKGLDGQYHGDINRVGKTSGIVFGSITIVQIAPTAKDDLVGFAAVLTAYFAFVGCADGYAAYLRSKSGRTETGVTTEPVADPATSKITKTTTEPAKGKK